MRSRVAGDELDAGGSELFAVAAGPIVWLGGFLAAAWGLVADLVGAGGDGVDLCGEVGVGREVLVGRGEQIGQGGRVRVAEGLV